ncbi:MAG: hypothetical protein PUE61_03130 [Clostridiales bacterium]|nr:hypothetical protein [Clostridiales bacterium]
MGLIQPQKTAGKTNVKNAEGESLLSLSAFFIFIVPAAIFYRIFTLRAETSLLNDPNAIEHLLGNNVIKEKSKIQNSFLGRGAWGAILWLQRMVPPT